MNEYATEISKVPLLSNEETIELINAMKNGNQEARKKLIKHNLRIVLKIASDFQRSINLPFDDLLGIGSLGLIKAIDNFDINRGYKLSTLSYRYIENVFNEYIRVSKMKKRDNSADISLEAQIYENKDGDGITLAEAIKDDTLLLEDVIFNNIRDEKIRNILKKLTKEERELLYLRYGIIDGINHTLDDIAKIQGVSVERIRQKSAKALKKLRHPQITRQIKDSLDRY